VLGGVAVRGKAMDNQWIWVLLLMMAAVAIGVWFIAHQVEKERKEQLGAVASRLGFEFSPESQPQMAEHLAHFPLFSRVIPRKRGMS